MRVTESGESDRRGAGELGQRLLEALLVEHPVGDLDLLVGDALGGAAAVGAGEGDAGRRVRVARHLLLAVGAAARGARRRGRRRRRRRAAGAAVGGLAPSGVVTTVSGPSAPEPSVPPAPEPAATAVVVGHLRRHEDGHQEQHQREHREGSVAPQEPLPDGEVAARGLRVGGGR